MSDIQVLSQETIDKIAAGEVVERPASVVKELVENAIDAKATAVTVEIKEGGTSFIRITDNGCGIPKEEVPLAFLRHSTSKIKSVDDLLTIASLGFRGEALSSISAVSQVELITKTRDSFSGVRYVIEGGAEKSLEEIGAPDGTTFLIRNLFYNTPARKKFLKTTATEGGYIQDIMERLALSHPGISFKLLNNTRLKLHTSGNGEIKDIIYKIYGRDIAANLIPIQYEAEQVRISGYIGKPVISRGNRQYENYFVNNRYVKSRIISKGIEQGYKSFLMHHNYPFTVLHASFEGGELDINVHPTKMELRFSNGEQVYQLFHHAIAEGLHKQELIPEVRVDEEKKPGKAIPDNASKPPEPFEKKRLEIEKEKGNEPQGETQDQSAVKVHLQDNQKKLIKETPSYPLDDTGQDNPAAYTEEIQMISTSDEISILPHSDDKQQSEQISLFAERLIEKEIRSEIQIIGQLFDTYWILQFENKMLIIDQHAAHEKVIYERIMRQLKAKEFTSQLLSPPLILTLSSQEAELLKKYAVEFKTIGFEIEPFGGKEYAIRAVPDNLYGLKARELFLEMLDGLCEEIGKRKPDMVIEKIASMSCKAAVKGNHKLSIPEANELLQELMKLENPYHCPHGRPVMISMTKTELEKKFKRIL